MNAVYDTYKPEGYKTVVPFILVKDISKMMTFLKDAFYAKEINSKRCKESNDAVIHASLLIGDTMIMMAQANPNCSMSQSFVNTTCAFCLYVDNVDSMYHHALDHGATSLSEPADMPYDDRQAGIKDVHGNAWWLSKRLKKEKYTNE